MRLNAVKTGRTVTTSVCSHVAASREGVFQVAAARERRCRQKGFDTLQRSR